MNHCSPYERHKRLNNNHPPPLLQLSHSRPLTINRDYHQPPLLHSTRQYLQLRNRNISRNSHDC
jgi:hypothetical protein